MTIARSVSFIHFEQPRLIGDGAWPVRAVDDWRVSSGTSGEDNSRLWGHFDHFNYGGRLSLMGLVCRPWSGICCIHCILVFSASKTSSDARRFFHVGEYGMKHASAVTAQEHIHPLSRFKVAVL